MLKLDATSENAAWNQIRAMGIKNRSKTLELVQLDKDDYNEFKY